MYDILQAANNSQVAKEFYNATGYIDVEINEPRINRFNPEPQTAFLNLPISDDGIRILWSFMGSPPESILIEPQDKPEALNIFEKQRERILNLYQKVNETINLSYDFFPKFVETNTLKPKNITYKIVISDLLPQGEQLTFIVPPFEIDYINEYFQEAYQAFMAQYVYPTETINLNYSGSNYANNVNTIKTGYERNQTLIINVSNLLPENNVLTFELPPFQASNYEAYLQDAYDSFMVQYVYPDAEFNLSYEASNYADQINDIINNYNRNQKLIINVAGALPDGNVLSFIIPPFEAANYEYYYQAAYDEYIAQNQLSEEQPIVIDQNELEEIVEEEVEEEFVEKLAPSILGGGGGGGFIDEEEEVIVGVDEGFVQKPKGIKIAGYVYPYSFIAITLGGGALGFFVSKKYKQQKVGMLALIAAGLMGGSAIGMKVKPPVKVPK